MVNKYQVSKQNKSFFQWKPDKSTCCQKKKDTNELDESEVIQLLNWCFKNPVIFGAYDSKDDLIEEQAETYRNEILKMNESYSFLDDLQNWLKK